MKRGDYLIVGIHGDALVNRIRGGNLPLMNLNERVLSVLGCKYVSDVLIDAPYSISPEMIASLSISEVCRGEYGDEMELPGDAESRYGVAINAGICTTIPVHCSFDIENIMNRIKKNQEAFQSRFERKMEAEDKFYQSVHSQRDPTSSQQ